MATVQPELETLWSHMTITHYVGVSALAFYAWDFILTFPDEVEYFWGGRWSFVKVLFFVNRYFTLAFTIVTTFFDVYLHSNPEICFAWSTFGMLAGIFSAVVVELILQIRLHALYTQNRKVILAISALFVVEITSMVTTVGMKIKNDQNNLGKIPGLIQSTPFCNGTIPRYFYAFWIPFMGFDFILLSLVVYRAVLHYQQLANKSWSGGALMSILIRDSVLYFVCNFAIFLCNALMWQLGPHDLLNLATSWAVAVPPIAAGRLLINMRTPYLPPVKKALYMPDLDGIGMLPIRGSLLPGGMQHRDSSGSGAYAY